MKTIKEDEENENIPNDDLISKSFDIAIDGDPEQLKNHLFLLEKRTACNRDTLGRFSKIEVQRKSMFEDNDVPHMDTLDSQSVMSNMTDDFDDLELDNTVDILGNANIKAATIDRLIDNLMTNNVTFIREFLDSFPLFMKAEDFLEILIDEFKKNQPVEISSANSNLGLQTIGRNEGAKFSSMSLNSVSRTMTCRRTHTTESNNTPNKEYKDMPGSFSSSNEKSVHVTESAPTSKAINLHEVDNISSLPRKGTEVSINYSMKSMHFNSSTTSEFGHTVTSQNTTRTVSLKIMRTWLISHYMDFQTSPTLLSRIATFLNEIDANLTKKDPLWRQVNIVIVTLNELKGTGHLREMQKESDLDDLLSWDFMKHQDVANSLTIICNGKHKMLKSRELMNGAWTSDKRNETAPNVIELINHFNKLSRVIQTQIVKSQNKSTRVSEIETWIAVAFDLAEIKNFSDLVAVMSALDSSPVQRLKKTWAKVSAKKKKILSDLKITYSPAGNYRNLRGIIDKLSEPTLPFLGCYLTQLTFIYDGGSTTIKDDWINFSKCRRVSNTLSAIRKSQNFACNFEVNIKKVNFLRQVLSIPGLTDDEIYKLSLKSEPRE